MQIKEVCRLCGLTKKAVEYYEAQGLIKPTQLPNGYRDYAEGDVATLKEIAVLRGCGASVAEISQFLASGDKQAALTRLLHLQDLKLQRQEQQRKLLARLAQDYQVERVLEQLKGEESGLTVRQRLVQAFPGNYGVYLSLHFGRFFNEPVKTPAQQTAFAKILEYLDNAAVAIPKELSDYLEAALPTQPDALEKMEQGVQQGLEQMLQDPEGAMQDYRQQGFDLDEYIAYRQSQEYQQSPAGRMTELLRAFQQDTGYTDVFLANLKILSPAYAEYCKQLEAANQKLLERYPQAAALQGE